MEKEKAVLLVVLAALSDGSKAVVSVTSGYRESTQSWSEVLRDLKRRGMGGKANGTEGLFEEAAVRLDDLDGRNRLPAVLPTASFSPQVETARLTIDLPRDMHRRFKIACTVAGTKMNAEIRRFIDRRSAELETSVE